MESPVKTLDGAEAGHAALADSVFGLEPRSDILQRMVRYQLARRQSGTHKTRRRSEIARTGAKIYGQKRGGRARHGAASAPLFRGGGKAFGPLPRSHAIGLQKKVRALALRHALSLKAKSGELVLVEKLDVDTAKTRDVFAKLQALGLSSALIVDTQTRTCNFVRAVANVREIDFLPTCGINVYDILRRKTLVLTRAALQALEERLQ